MARINVIYHHYPFYRLPVMRELVGAGRHEYRFWGSLDAVEGVEAFRGDDVIAIRPLRFALHGRLWRLGGYWPAVLDRSSDVLLVHGHPNMPASWLIGLVGRATGKKIAYWAHGWLRPEPLLKAILRRYHYLLGHRVLTYGERAAHLASASGFPSARIVPIYNSLDWRTAEKLLAQFDAEGRASIRARLGVATDIFRLTCVARLIPACRFDLLVDAMTILARRGLHTELCLIGDGPDRAMLEERAASSGVGVTFAGAIHDEARIGAELYASDLTVCPGKAGLSAIHSMMYGTPVISHGDMNRQMPEAEAIIPGRTGDFFACGDAEDLARVIARWMAREDRTATRRHCTDMIETRYNPVTQAERIDRAISGLFGGPAR